MSCTAYPRRGVPPCRPRAIQYFIDTRFCRRYLDVDKILVHKLCRHFILETLVGKDMTP